MIFDTRFLRKQEGLGSKLFSVGHYDNKSYHKNVYKTEVLGEGFKKLDTRLRQKLKFTHKLTEN